MKTDNINIDLDLCINCKVCVETCPNGIFALNGHLHTIPERVPLCVECGQCMAVCPEMAIKVNGLEYEKDFFNLTNNDYLEPAFQSLIESRRSIRVFKDKPVPIEKLEEIVNAISFSPPSFPPLKIELTVVQGKETIKKALPYMIELYENLMKNLKNPIGRYFVKKATGKDKFRVIKNHIVPMFAIKLKPMKDGLEDDITRNAQAMILFHANRNADNYVEDIYVALSFGLLKAHSIGIGATAIDLIPPAVERSAKLREMFKIPKDNVVIASMILGYPKYRFRRGIKRKLKNVNWL
jgi:NAD-dependent dihydropyrimidine dehydrogenase PreA subunit/nitroreductase